MLLYGKLGFCCEDVLRSIPQGDPSREAHRDDARRRSPELRRAVARANAAEAAQRKMSVEVQSLTTQLQTIAQRKRQGSR